MKKSKEEMIEELPGLFNSKSVAFLMQQYADQEIYAQQREQPWRPLNSESMPERDYMALFTNINTTELIVASMDKDDQDYLIGNEEWGGFTHWLKIPGLPPATQTKEFLKTKRSKP